MASVTQKVPTNPKYRHLLEMFLHRSTNRLNQNIEPVQIQYQMSIQRKTSFHLLNESPLQLGSPRLHKESHTESTDDEYSEGYVQCDYSDNQSEFPHYSECAKSHKYKTEMCKNYSQMGYCPYYQKCQFAHGFHDLALTPALINKLTRLSSRNRKCKNFWNTGQCAYGLRCQFSHYEVKPETLRNLKILAAVCQNPEQQPVVNCRSRLLQGLYTDYSSLYSLLDE